MRFNLSIKSVGLALSAVLAVIYVLIIVTSLLLVGFFTNGSLRSALVGIRWRTIVGFEIGLLGVVIVGFFIAAILVPIFNFIRQRVTGWLMMPARPNPSGGSSVRMWTVWTLAACLVIPALTLLGLYVLATAASPSTGPGADKANTKMPGERKQPVNMGGIINSAFKEAEPSFTADGQTMYFNCNDADICVSHLIGTWEQGSWTPPQLLGSPINTEYEEIEPVINAAGNQLYFTSIRPIGRLKGLPFLSPIISFFRVVNTLATVRLGRTFFGGLGLDDVYVSYWIDSAWSEPRNINDIAGEPPINTEFADHCLFFSSDGNEAFWTSTRPGGFGDTDIWTSRRVGNKWTQPENLGPNVNGPGNEHTSIPTPDGRSLYVTSDRPGGFGGEDIYVTTRHSDGTWGPLVNLGSPVNGIGDDRCPAWTPDLKIFLFDSVRQGGFGGRDIWWGYFKDVTGHPIAAVSTGGTNLTPGAQVSHNVIP